jgi:hypothetical protein
MPAATDCKATEGRTIFRSPKWMQRIQWLTGFWGCVGVMVALGAGFAVASFFAVFFAVGAQVVLDWAWTRRHPRVEDAAAVASLPVGPERL